MQLKLISLLAERAAIKAKLMTFKRFVEVADFSSDILACEECIKANRSLYSQFDHIQSQIEMLAVGTRLQMYNLEERKLFEAIYFGVISIAEKHLNDIRTAQALASDPIPGTSGSHTTSHLPVIQPALVDDIPERWYRMIEWENWLIQKLERANNCEDLIQAIQQRAEYLEKLFRPTASSTIEEQEHSHASNSSEHPHASDGSEHPHTLDGDEHPHASDGDEHSDSSKHSHISNNNNHSGATNSSIIVGYEISFLGYNRTCWLCQGRHALHTCPQLLAMPFSERYEKIKNLRVCFNCLYFGHSVMECTSNKCKKCGKKHHTILHREKKEKVVPPKRQPLHIVQACIWNAINNEYTVLSTLIVYVIDDTGDKHQCRALLDAGSQVNLITKNFCDKLQLAVSPVDIPPGPPGPFGLRNPADSVGNDMNSIQFKTQLRIISELDEFTADISCLVLKDVADKILDSKIPVTMVNVSVPVGITPADPQFQHSDNIDLLIGTGLFWKLLCIGQYRINPGNLVWLKTHFGWVLDGYFYKSSNGEESI